MTAASRAASLSAVSALVLAAVWFLWPADLGGGTTYVTTHGISMEPRFHTGDLAVLRSADSYAVGDVVAYRSELLHTIVMHRIVDGNAQGFVTQGDNNSWQDEDRPTEDDVLGRLLTRVPQGGKALAAVKSPGVLPLVAAGGISLLTAARIPRTRRGLRAARRRRRQAFSMPTRALARQVSVVSGAVALLAATGLVVAASLPDTETGTRTLQVTQQGQYSYTGAAVPGATYPTGVIATGDTVWTRLATGLTVSLTTAVRGPHVADVRGNLRLDVVVTAADGWSAVVDTGSAHVLEQGSGTASVALDPTHATTLLARHFAEIGTTGGTATLTVAPVAKTTGTVEGRPFTLGAPAGLTFTMEELSLKPPANGLTPTARTAVQVHETVPRALRVLSVSVPIDVARIVALAVLAIASLLTAAGAWIGRGNPTDAADRFLVRHADRILPVASYTPGPAVVDVADAESLHKVAERFDTLVLHHSGPDEDVFLVRDVEMTYRFVVPVGPERRRGMPPVPAAGPARAATRTAAPGAVPVPADATGPLPMVVPVPVPVPAPVSVSVSGALWGRFA